MRTHNQNPFRNYWVSLNSDAKRELSRAAGTSSNYLTQVAHGHRRAGISLISRLCRVDSNISQEMMRPDLYAQIESNEVQSA